MSSGSSSFGSSGSSFGSSGSSSSGGFSLGTGSGSGSSSGNSLTSGFNLGVSTATNNTGGGRGGTSAIGSTTFLGPYYSNPLAMGMTGNTSGTTTSTATFGNPIFTNLVQQTTTTQSYNIPGRTNTSSSSSAVITAPNMVNGLGNGWQGRRPVAYRISTDLPSPRVTTGQMRSDLQALLARSSRLSNPSGIRVVMDGGTVVLQGKVPSQAERRLVENLVRTERGVGAVRNELQAPAEAAE
jgi:osmotically-inducible protein OsmY